MSYVGRVNNVLMKRFSPLACLAALAAIASQEQR